MMGSCGKEQDKPLSDHFMSNLLEIIIFLKADIDKHRSSTQFVAVDLPGISNDETAEHCSNSSTRSSHSDCGGSSTNEFGSGINVPAHSTGLEASESYLGEGALWHEGYVSLKNKHLLSDGKRTPTSITIKGIDKLWKSIRPRTTRRCFSPLY